MNKHLYRRRLWLLPLSEFFLAAVSETSQNVFNSEWDLLAHTTAGLMSVTPGKAKTRGSQDDARNLCLPIAWPCFFCLGFALRQLFSSWWRDKSSQVTSRRKSAPQHATWDSLYLAWLGLNVRPWTNLQGLECPGVEFYDSVSMGLLPTTGL